MDTTQLLITIEGPRGAGKSHTAQMLKEHFEALHRTVVIVEADQVAVMSATTGARLLAEAEQARVRINVEMASE